MKKLLTSSTSATSGQPIPSESIDFWQEAAKNAVKMAVLGMYKDTYSTNDIVILYGCENTGSGLNYIISAGAVYYNGEVYEVDAITFTASGGQVACAKTVDTYESFDPITFTDLTTHSVHLTRKVTFVSGLAGGSGVTDYIGDFSAFLSSGKIIHPLYATKATQNTGAASTSYTVQFDTVVTDGGSILNTGTGVFTPKKGWQKITAQVTVDPTVNYNGQISLSLYNAGTNTLIDTVATVGYDTTQKPNTLQMVNYFVNFDGVTTYKIVTTSSALDYDITSASLCVEPVSKAWRM